MFVLMFLPYITGDWSSSNMEWNIGANGGLALALVWLYFMCWSSYGIEVVATFTPEYHDTERDTARALRSAALFSGVVFISSTGIILAPVMHHVLHRFHIEKKESE